MYHMCFNFFRSRVLSTKSDSHVISEFAASVMSPKISQISSMEFVWFRAESSGAATSTASSSDPTSLLEKKCWLRCDSVSDQRVTGEGLLALVEISEEGV